MDKLENVLGGIKNMKSQPAAVFIVDPNREHITVKEAKKLKVPLVAIVDTNCDPTNVDYVIPSNDDAIRAIKLIVSKIADAVIEGKALRGEGNFDEGSLSDDSKPDNAKHLYNDTGDMEDEDLFGASTLAKLGNMKAVKQDVDDNSDSGEHDESAEEE